MARDWSLGDVMLRSIGSTILYVPLALFAWGFGVCLGAAIHDAQLLSMWDWFGFPITGCLALLVLPIVHHWLLIFWFTVPLTAVRGLYMDTSLPRAAIFIALALQGGLFSYFAG